jgi:hypothetical protein
MNNKSLSFILIYLWMFAGVVIAAPPTDTPGRIPTVTRLVKLFYEREGELVSALKNKEQVKLDALVAEDFELRSAAAPGVPVPRADWLSKSLAEASAYSGGIEQMAVHGLNDTSIVSFLWKSANSVQTGALPDVFVIDVWRLSGNEWKLAIRYASPTSSANARLPGFAPPSDVIEKRY